MARKITKLDEAVKTALDIEVVKEIEATTLQPKRTRKIKEIMTDPVAFAENFGADLYASQKDALREMAKKPGAKIKRVSGKAPELGMSFGGQQMARGHARKTYGGIRNEARIVLMGHASFNVIAGVARTQNEDSDPNFIFGMAGLVTGVLVGDQKSGKLRFRRPGEPMAVQRMAIPDATQPY